jgi:DNA-binding NarL/FixJ family response regulator
MEPTAPKPPPSERATARVALVEDDPNVREHLIDLITWSPHLDLAGVAPTLRQGRELIALQPDIFLLDIGLPDGSGLDLIADIKAAGDARVLVLTMYADRETVVSAVRGGADGYLLKDSSAAVILEGIAVTLQGGAPISAPAAVFLLERLRQDPVPRASPPIGADTLTEREVAMLRLFARGLSYKETARELGISPLTVGNYVKSVYRKLEVNSRGEAVYAAGKMHKLDVD